MEPVTPRSGEELRQVDDMVTGLLEQVAVAQRERELAERRSSSMISLYEGAMDVLEQAQTLVEQAEGEPATEQLTQLIRSMEERTLEAVDARHPGLGEQRQQASARLEDMEGIVQTLQGQLTHAESEAAQLNRELQEARQAEPILRQEYADQAHEAAARHLQEQTELAKASEVTAMELRNEMTSFALRSEEEQRNLDEQYAREQEALKAEVAAVKAALKAAARAALPDGSLSARNVDRADAETLSTIIHTPAGHGKSAVWSSTPLSVSPVTAPVPVPEPEPEPDPKPDPDPEREPELQLEPENSQTVATSVPAEPKSMLLVPAGQGGSMHCGSVIAEQQADKCSPRALLQMAVVLRRWHQARVMDRMCDDRLRRKLRWALRRWRRRVSNKRDAQRAHALDYAKQTRKMLHDRMQWQKQRQTVQLNKQPRRQRFSTPQKRSATPEHSREFQLQSMPSFTNTSGTSVRLSVREASPTPIVSPTRARPYPHKYSVPRSPRSPHRDKSQAVAKANADPWVSPRTSHQSPEVVAGHSAGPLRIRHGALTPVELSVSREMQPPADREWLPPSAVTVPASPARPARVKTPSKRLFVATRRKHVKSPRRVEVLDTETHSVLTRVMGRLWDFLVDTPNALAPLRSIAEVLLLVRHRQVDSTYRDISEGQLVDMGGHLAGLPPARHHMRAEQLRPVLRKLLRQAGILVSQSEFSEVMSKLDPSSTSAVDLEHLLAVAYSSYLEIVRQKMLSTSKTRDGKDWIRALKLKSITDDQLLAGTEYSRCADPLISRETLFTVARDLINTVVSGDSRTLVTTSELTDVCDFLSDVWLEDTSSHGSVGTGRRSLSVSGRGLSTSKLKVFLSRSGTADAVHVSIDMCRMWIEETLCAISHRMHELHSSQDEACRQCDIHTSGHLDLVDLQVVANHLKIGSGCGRLAMIFMLLDTTGTGSLRVHQDLIGRVWAHRHGITNTSGTSPRYSTAVGPNSDDLEIEGDTAAGNVSDNFPVSTPPDSLSLPPPSPLSRPLVKAVPEPLQTPVKGSSVHRGSDYYTILGVRPGSTPKQIRRAYLTKAAASPAGHLVRSDVGTGASLAELAEAYEVLCDSYRRAQYDSTLNFKDSPSKPPSSAETVGTSSVHLLNELSTHEQRGAHHAQTSQRKSVLTTNLMRLRGGLTVGHLPTESTSPLDDRTPAAAREIEPEPEPEPGPGPQLTRVIWGSSHNRQLGIEAIAHWVKAATVIQAHWRGVSTRKLSAWESLHNRQLELDAIVRWIKAATVIQAHWRGVSARRALFYDCIAAFDLLTQVNSSAYASSHSETAQLGHETDANTDEVYYARSGIVQKSSKADLVLVSAGAAEDGQPPLDTYATSPQDERAASVYTTNGVHWWREGLSGERNPLEEKSQVVDECSNGNGIETDIHHVFTHLDSKHTEADQRKLAMATKFTQLRDSLTADTANTSLYQALEHELQAESHAKEDEVHSASEKHGAVLKAEVAKQWENEAVLKAEVAKQWESLKTELALSSAGAAKDKQSSLDLNAYGKLPQDEPATFVYTMKDDHWSEGSTTESDPDESFDPMAASSDGSTSDTDDDVLSSTDAVARTSHGSSAASRTFSHESTHSPAGSFHMGLSDSTDSESDTVVDVLSSTGTVARTLRGVVQPVVPPRTNLRTL